MGKSTRHKHAHMHTQPEPGINTGRAEVLLKSFTLTELTVIPQANNEFYDPENITMEGIDAKFDKLNDQVFAPADGDGLGSEVPLNEVYDLSELESIQAGTALMTMDEELDLNKEKHGCEESWDETSLLHSLGVDCRS